MDFDCRTGIGWLRVDGVQFVIDDVIDLFVVVKGLQGFLMVAFLLCSRVFG